MKHNLVSTRETISMLKSLRSRKPLKSQIPFSHILAMDLQIKMIRVRREQTPSEAVGQRAELTGI